MADNKEPKFYGIVGKTNWQIPKQTPKEDLWSNSRKRLKEIVDDYCFFSKMSTDKIHMESLADLIEQEFGQKLKKLEELETLGIVEIMVRLPQVAENISELENKLQEARDELAVLKGK